MLLDECLVNTMAITWSDLFIRRGYEFVQNTSNHIGVSHFATEWHIERQ